MIVKDSNIWMASSHEAQTTHERRERLLTWVGERPVEPVEERSPAAPDAELDLSALAASLAPVRRTEVIEEWDDDAYGVIETLEMRLVEMLVRMLTGKNVDIETPAEVAEAYVEDALTVETVEGGGSPGMQGWGIEYDFYESRVERESMGFAAEGLVKTADGREIDIEVNLRMSREFAEVNQISYRAGDAVMKDPLVINFNGRGAQLTKTKFAFDLDMDGREEQVSFVRPGSGFLALDKNEDGKINDGGELFGPQTDDGFGELAAYDDDGNGWIDEADAVWSKLRIWTKGSDGEDRLFALGKAGIGAIYLGHEETEFSLKDRQNEQHGRIRATSFFLYEQGGAGIVQELDLVV